MWPRWVVAVLALLCSDVCRAYEADVHFGLTKWLAIQAGFEPWEADSIAIGDQRVDSGDMQYIALLPTYACLAHDQEMARLVGLLHFPTEGQVPAAPDQRVVTAGSEAAQKAVHDIEKSPASQSVFRLYLIGAALHPLQDSWAHQGAPDVPQPLGPVSSCDPAFAWSNPSARGGWNTHKADLAHAWPADTLAMARATYSALQQMPPVLGAKRSPKVWANLVPKIDAFLRASTKTEERKWFAAQGIDDVSFLEGISIPDGAQRFDLRWPGRKLPPLSTLQSTQHHLAQDLLDAMSRFFTQWVSATDFDALAAEMAVPPTPAHPAGDAQSPETAPADKAELAARLRAWRIRDHGRIAEIAHAPHALSAQQRAELSRIASDPRQLASYTTPVEAYFPLLVNGPEPSPLLGFILYPISPSSRGNARVIAVAKFRHAPYDTVEVLAERIENRWRIAAIRAVVDH